MKQIIAVLFFTLGVTVASAQSWTLQNSGTTNQLGAVWFTDVNNGWAVGDLGISIVTANGGQTWNTVVLTGQDLEDVAFSSTSIGAMVGDNGLILRTINGGASWSAVASGTGSNLRTVTFGDGGMAYVGGRDGIILRSTNSGESWSVVETGTVRYRGSSAQGGQHGWIVGEGGVIKATTNAGVSWITQAGGTGSDLHAVFFLTTNEGWIGGQNNTLLYTSNGGATWVSRNTGINVGIDGIHFLNSNDGWAVADFGAIFRTTNGGVNWFSEASGTTNGFNDLFFVDAGHGWAVGDAGTISHRSLPTAVGYDQDPLPVQTHLLQNYPNPFNPSTTIPYVVGEEGHVELSIFNLVGQKVATVVNKDQKRGEYVVRFDASALTSGVYIARLQTAGGLRTRARKITLMK